MEVDTRKTEPNLLKKTILPARNHSAEDKHHA